MNNLNKNIIYMYNPKTNSYKKVKLGVSITVALSLLVGAWIVPFFRKDLRITALIVLILLATISLQNANTTYYALIVFLSYGILGFLIFFYNKLYFKDLIKKGFKILNIEGSNVMNKNVINTNLENMGFGTLENNMINASKSKEEIDNIVKLQNRTMYIITTLVWISLVLIFAYFISKETIKNINKTQQTKIESSIDNKEVKSQEKESFDSKFFEL